MNETTNLNSELLSADARGRKHIPFAVFAVILIHVALFLVLLIAAGCRAKARALRKLQSTQPLLAEQAQSPTTQGLPVNFAAVAESTNAPAAVEPLVQPAAEPHRPAATPANTTVRQAVQAGTPTPRRATSADSRRHTVYVVKAGDTVEKIARMHRTSVEAIKAENNLKGHLIRPGQQLRVSSEKAKKRNEA
jgi:nucleoid-associated protein YgaU